MRTKHYVTFQDLVNVNSCSNYLSVLSFKFRKAKWVVTYTIYSLYVGT